MQALNSTVLSFLGTILVKILFLTIGYFQRYILLAPEHESYTPLGAIACPGKIIAFL